MSKAKAYKSRLSSPLTADVALPSGAVFTLRRPPLDQWLLWGRVPDFLLSVAPAMETLKEQQPNAAQEDLEFQHNVNMAKALILYAVVDPSLKIGAKADEDALDPAEIDSEDMTFLFDYVCRQGCPDVPVKTKEGQVSVDALTTFRQKRPGGESVRAGAGGGDDSASALGAAGN